MATKKVPQFVYDYKKTEEYKMHLAAMEMLAKMTPEEKTQTLIRAGILSKSGELVKRFGGSGPNPEEEEEEQVDDDD